MSPHIHQYGSLSRQGVPAQRGQCKARKGASGFALALPVPHKYLLDFKMPLRYGTRHGGSDPGWRSPAG